MTRCASSHATRFFCVFVWKIAWENFHQNIFYEYVKRDTEPIHWFLFKTLKIVTWHSPLTTMGMTIFPCNAKRQQLLTSQVSSYRSYTYVFKQISSQIEYHWHWSNMPQEMLLGVSKKYIFRKLVHILKEKYFFQCMKKYIYQMEYVINWESTI